MKLAFSQCINLVKGRLFFSCIIFLLSVPTVEAIDWPAWLSRSLTPLEQLGQTPPVFYENLSRPNRVSDVKVELVDAAVVADEYGKLRAMHPPFYEARFIGYSNENTKLRVSIEGKVWIEDSLSDLLKKDNIESSEGSIKLKIGIKKQVRQTSSNVDDSYEYYYLNIEVTRFDQ